MQLKKGVGLVMLVFSICIFLLPEQVNTTCPVPECDGVVMCKDAVNEEYCCSSLSYPYNDGVCPSEYGDWTTVGCVSNKCITEDYDCCPNPTTNWDPTNWPGDITQKCCGDDANENVEYRYCYTGQCTSNTGDIACCDNGYDCVWNGACHTSVTTGKDTTSLWVGTNSESVTGEYLCGGASVIVDCDYYWSYCEYDTLCDHGDTGWLAEGEADIFGGYGDTYGSVYGDTPAQVQTGAFSECCGDDVGEEPRTCVPLYVGGNDGLDPNICTISSRCCAGDPSTFADNKCLYDGKCLPQGEAMIGPYEMAFCSLHEILIATLTDPDYGQNDCETSATFLPAEFECAGAECWVQAGTTSAFGEYEASDIVNPECCGDDASEYFTYCAAYGTIAWQASCNTATDYCCNFDDACINTVTGRCFAEGASAAGFNPGNNDDTAYCIVNAATDLGTWRDCDYNQATCGNCDDSVDMNPNCAGQDCWLQGAPTYETPTDLPGEYAGNWYTGCCGDDTNEYNVSCVTEEITTMFSDTACDGFYGKGVCCDDATDCLNRNDGKCYNTGIKLDADGDGAIEWCDAGTWNSLANGDYCSIGSDCQSGLCVDTDYDGVFGYDTMESICADCNDLTGAVTNDVCGSIAHKIISIGNSKYGICDGDGNWYQCTDQANPYCVTNDAAGDPSDTEGGGKILSYHVPNIPPPENKIQDHDFIRCGGNKVCQGTTMMSWAGTNSQAGGSCVQLDDDGTNPNSFLN